MSTTTAKTLIAAAWITRYARHPRHGNAANPYVLSIQTFETDPYAVVRTPEIAQIMLRTDRITEAAARADQILAALNLHAESGWSDEFADESGLGERLRCVLAEVSSTEVEVPVSKLIEEYVAVLVAAIDAYWKASGWQHAQPTVSIERGRVYSKIVKFDGTQHAVHSFVKNETGEVIKAAGWSSPAKDKGGLAVRFNLTDAASRQACFALVDPFGGYLYKR